jgi:subtilase family serine protease
MVNGQEYTINNVPQPGRTDLDLLCYPLGNDLAVMPGSLRIDPSNPNPGSNVVITATVENRGDRPLQNIEVEFFDGNPIAGGVRIAVPQSIAGPLVGGATQQVTVLWTVPVGTNSHEVFAVADPSLLVEDRDRANNSASLLTALPDLTIQTCWSVEVSQTNVLLAARIANIGVVSAGSCELSWRFGAIDGPEIGRTIVNSMASGQTNEVTFSWNINDLHFSEPFTSIFAVVDAGNAVQEIDELNNTYAQTVRVLPGWLPRFVELRIVNGTNAVLSFEADGYAATAFSVEGATSLGPLIHWVPDANATVTTNSFGRFQAQIPLQGNTRYFRVTAP